MTELNWFHALFMRIYDYLSNPKLWVGIGVAIIKIMIITVAARIVVSIIEATVNRVFQKRENSKLKIDQRRVETLRVLTNNVARYSIYFLAILLVLKQVGFDLQPVLVSAGVLGLAVGFGAQSLVRDVITGFFIIFEDQFAVGDVVTINGLTGSVQEIGLRITKIKSWTGEVHIFPNGTIQQVTNFSMQNSVAVVDVSVAYEEDIAHVQEVLQEMLPHFKEKDEDIVEEPQVLGVQAFGPSDVIIRITAECKPTMHHGVMRRLRAAIKAELEAKGIEIPYPKTVLMSNPNSSPTAEKP